MKNTDILIAYFLKRIDELSILAKKKAEGNFKKLVEDKLKKGNLKSVSSIIASAEANEYAVKMDIFMEEIELLKEENNG